MIQIQCRSCREIQEVKVSPEGLKAWRSGQHIQDALPELSAGERELLISQICEPCFDRICAEPVEEGETNEFAG